MTLYPCHPEERRILPLYHQDSSPTLGRTNRKQRPGYASNPPILCHREPLLRGDLSFSCLPSRRHINRFILRNDGYYPSTIKILSCRAECAFACCHFEACHFEAVRIAHSANSGQGMCSVCRSEPATGLQETNIIWRSHYTASLVLRPTYKLFLSL